jgi:hypothetical protein
MIWYTDLTDSDGSDGSIRKNPHQSVRSVYHQAHLRTADRNYLCPPLLTAFPADLPVALFGAPGVVVSTPAPLL